MQETQVYSLLMLGSSQCGKTLLNRVYNEKYNTSPTPTELADNKFWYNKRISYPKNDNYNMGPS